MSESAALLGRVIAGKFQIEELVGSGAMGEVFRARHIVLDTAVALKIMRGDIAKDGMFKERFYREAKAASRLDHPNSVRVLDFGVESDGLVYLAMEFLHGRDLLSVLREEWPLPDERIVDILAQTLSAVSMAHDLGIVHRDLKPENIMVQVGHEEDGHRPYHVKVCDFGIAKLNDPRGFQTENGRSLTSSGTLIGTPEYMSPEQARGDALDARSDLYSVGIVLYQLLVGRVPFTAENALGVVLKQVTDEPVPPSLVRPGVNARLEAICLRALQKARDERYQTAAQMRRDLKGVFGYRPGSPDESAKNLATYAARNEGSLPDTSNAATIIQAIDPAHAETQPNRTLPAPRASVAGRVAAQERATVDLSPKETSAGTELTVGPAPGARRRLGVMLIVAGVALLVGAGVVVGLAARGAAGAKASAGGGASASAAANANRNLPASGSAEASASASATTEASGNAEGSGEVAPSAAVASAHGRGASTSASGRVAAGSARAVGAATTVPNGATVGSPSAASSSSSSSSSALAAVALPPYNPAGAFVALGATTHGRIREDVVRSKMSALLPKLSECYRSALGMVGAAVGGSASIQLSIDEKGSVIAMVDAPKLQPFARCAQAALVGTRMPVSALEEPSAGATASQWLDLHP